MTSIFLPLALIALLGVLLRHFVPGMEDRRQAMNQMVLYVFLPALVFHTVMEARLDRLFVEIPIVAATCVLGCLAAAFVLFHFRRSGRSLWRFCGRLREFPAPRSCSRRPACSPPRSPGSRCCLSAWP